MSRWGRLGHVAEWWGSCSCEQEGFFWTAVDAIVQLVMGGTRTIARIPLLLRENKIVAILLILWVFGK